MPNPRTTNGRPYIRDPDIKISDPHPGPTQRVLLDCRQLPPYDSLDQGPARHKKRTAFAVPFPTCQARYAEREPATGRAVLLAGKPARSFRPESSPGTAGPHEFYSTSDKYHVRQLVRGDSPQKMTLGDSVNNRQGSFPFSFGI